MTSRPGSDSREVQHEDRRGDGEERRHDPDQRRARGPAGSYGCGGRGHALPPGSITERRIRSRPSASGARERESRAAATRRRLREGFDWRRAFERGCRGEACARPGKPDSSEGAGASRPRRARRPTRGAPTADRAGARRCGDRSEPRWESHPQHRRTSRCRPRRARSTRAGTTGQGSWWPFAHRDPRGSQGQRRDDEHRASGARDRPHARDATPGPDCGSPRHAGRVTPGPCWRT